MNEKEFNGLILAELVKIANDVFTNEIKMFCLMLLLFGAVVFISGTDPKKLKDFINKDDQSDKF